MKVPFLARRCCLLLFMGAMAARSLCAFQPFEPTRNLQIEVQGTQEMESDGRQIMEGNVRVAMPGTFLMTADRCEYTPKTKILKATGNVKIDFQTQLGIVEVTAREMFYDTDAKSGGLHDVTAAFAADFFFTGERLEVYDGGLRFSIENGVITSCNQPVAEWSLKIKRARIEREGYAVMSGARFRVLDVGLIYIPWMIVPAMTERRSGLLPPDTGNSDRNGVFFSLPYYWAPRQDFDMTLTPTFYRKGGAKLDLEARYQPTHQFGGVFRGGLWHDRVLDAALEQGNVPMEDGKRLKADRFRLNWDHDQSIWSGRFQIRMDAGSDFNYERDLLQDALSTRLRDYYFRSRFDKDFELDRLSISVNRLDRILVGQSGAQNAEISILGQFPSLRYYQPMRSIGGGFFYRNQFYLDGFHLEDIGPRVRKGDLVRAGTSGELSRRLDLGRWIHTSYGISANAALYKGDYEPTAATTLDHLSEPVDTDGESGSGFAFWDVRGPHLQRAYSIANRRLVHFIDAGLEMRYGTRQSHSALPEIELDELDILTQNSPDGPSAAWLLGSRFFWGESGRIMPLIEMEIRQEADLDKEQGLANAPIETRFRLINLGGFNAHGLFEFNPDSNEMRTLSVYGSVNRGGWTGYGGYVKRRDQPGSLQDSFIGTAELKMPHYRSRFRFAMDYDFILQDFKSQEFIYGYQGQCVGAGLSYIRSPFNSTINGGKDFVQFTLSLRNLGDLSTRF